MVAVEPNDDLTPIERMMVPVDAEPSPEDGVENDDRVELVRTGLIRVWIGGKRYRLRRPFFGEFRQIRTALQDMNDEIAEASDSALREARQLSIDAQEQGADDMDPEAWQSWRRDARKRSNEATRTLSEFVDDTRIGWWSDVWDVLSLDGAPPDWPAWIIDPKLAGETIGHWRSSPLGRG